MQIAIEIPAIARASLAKWSAPKAGVFTREHLFEVADIDGYGIGIRGLDEGGLMPGETCRTDYVTDGAWTYRAIQGSHTRAGYSDLRRLAAVTAAHALQTSLRGVKASEMSPPLLGEKLFEAIVEHGIGFDSGYALYEDILASRHPQSVVADAPAYEAAHARMVDLVGAQIARYAVFGGFAHERTPGPLWRVGRARGRAADKAIHMELVDGLSPPVLRRSLPLLAKREKEARPSVERFFGIDETEEAIAAARRLAGGEPIVVSAAELEWADAASAVLPPADGAAADFVSVAKTCAFVVGREVARRIKNQEVSIFESGDEMRIRAAFDRLSAAVSRITPFFEDCDEAVEALSGLLVEIRSDVTFINGTYREMASKYDDVFAAADEAILRWSERPVDVAIANQRWPAQEPARFEDVMSSILFST